MECSQRSTSLRICGGSVAAFGICLRLSGLISSRDPHDETWRAPRSDRYDIANAVECDLRSIHTAQEYPDTQDAEYYRCDAIDRGLGSHITSRDGLRAHEVGECRIEGDFHKQVVCDDDDSIREAYSGWENRDQDSRSEQYRLGIGEIDQEPLLESTYGWLDSRLGENRRIPPHPAREVQQVDSSYDSSADVQDGKQLKGYARPRSAINVQVAAIRPSPAPNSTPVVRPALKEVWIAVSSAGPGLAMAANRTTLNATSCSRVMDLLLGLR